jgi:hypothetical protein
MQRGHHLRARLSSLGRDRYVQEDGTIYRFSDLGCVGAIQIDGIRSWTVYPEMTFDIVDIEDRTAKTFRWFDYDGELTRMLEAAKPRAQ